MGIFCDAADLLNAAWYASEGNYQMAMACGIAAIPLAGSGIAAGLKLAMGAEKAAKAVKIVKSVTKLATFTSAATITAIDTYYAVVDAKASYDAGTLTFGEAAKVAVLGGATAALSIAAGKSAIGTANVLHETNAVRKAINGVTEGITKLHNDNRGCVDLSAFSRNGAKDAMKGGETSVINSVQSKSDFIVTPNGVAMPTNQDFNLVSTTMATNNGGEYLQIHNQHIHGNLTNPHTHKPQVNINPVTGMGSSKRLDVETSANDIDYADEVLKNGILRKRFGKKDKGGY